MKRLTIISLILLAAGFSLKAQYAEDVLRYSRYSIGGSARYMATGGAFGALGADFTTASVNPAGIGLYKSSEFVLTPAIFWQKTESMYNGSMGEDSRTIFNMGNAGMVFTSKALTSQRASGWKRVQFATGINRVKDFNNRILIRGPNEANSLLDTYLIEAEGPPQIPYQTLENDNAYGFDLGLAWWTFLLDIYGDTVNYNYYTPVPFGGVFQSKSIETKGSLNEYVFTISSNYNDRLYIGLTFGIPFLRYYQRSVYTEQDVADTIFDFARFNRTEYLETRGSGINLKFGLIYRVTDWLRLGAAVHTPTWYNRLRDYYWATMESFFDNGDNYYETSPEGNFEYSMQTPFRAIASAAFIFGGKGLLSIDYEFADYSTGKLKQYSGYYTEHFSAENENIRRSYGSAHNIRVGTEWKYQIFSFRAGFGYAGSPYESDINDGQTTTYSAGIGLRQKAFFMDLAYVHSRTVKDYYLYYTPEVTTQPAENQYLTNNVLLTIGFRFN
jgi:hypothetical protein